MKSSNRTSNFASRPEAEELWVHREDLIGSASPSLGNLKVRLTVDVTPALRSRIKVAAITREMTLKDMLLELLAREFPEIEGGRS